MAEDIKKEQEVQEEIVVETEEVKVDKKDKKTNKYKEQLAERDKEIFQLKDQLLRNVAELENFKKKS